MSSSTAVYEASWDGEDPLLVPVVVAATAGEVVLEHAGARGSRARLEQVRVVDHLLLGAGLSTPGVAGVAGGPTRLKTRLTRTRTTERSTWCLDQLGE